MSEDKVSAEKSDKRQRRDALPSGCEVYATHKGGQDYHPVLSVKRDVNGQFWIVDTAALHGLEVMQAFDQINVPHPGDEYIVWWQIRIAWYKGPDYLTQERGAEPRIIREAATNPFMALRAARLKYQGFRHGYRPVLGMSLPLEPLEMLSDQKGITYSGETDGRSCWRVFRDGHKLEPVASQAIRNYSLGGFRWGGPGPGSKQLALGLLLDAAGDIPSIRLLSPAYSRDVIERLLGSWTLPRQDILNWLAGQPVPSEDSEERARLPE